MLNRKSSWSETKQASGSKLREKAEKSTSVRSTMKKRWERLRNSVRGRILISQRPRRHRAEA